MSTEARALVTEISGSQPWRFWTGDLQQSRIVRFAIGVTLALAIAYGFNWPLAFLMPVLAAVFLAMPLPCPGASTVLKNMLQTLLAFAVGSVFTLLLLPFPLIYIPMLALVLFHIYYYSNRGGSFWLVLMLIVAVLILPLLGNTHEGLALGFATGFVITGWLAMGMILVAHLLAPDPAGTPPLPANAVTRTGFDATAARSALKSTLVVFPIASIFVIFDLSSYLLVMVFAAIFSLHPDIEAGRSQGMQSLTATLIGAAGALIGYALIVVVPEFYIFIFLMFAVAMVFGSGTFSGRSTAKYYGSALVALLLLVNGSLGENSDIFANILTRAGLIGLSAIYIVTALRVLERYLPEKFSIR